MYADLHIHSWYSDGTLSLTEIIDKAKSQNITTISICDHELIDVYTEIENTDGINGIKIIPGVEITANMDGTSYHILAYAFDMHNEPLQVLLKYNRSIYVDMGNNLIANMMKDYPSLLIEEYSLYKRNRKNGGWDSIDYLRSKGLVCDWESYVDLATKYASPLKSEFLSVQEVINIIHGAGGYAILAHLCHHTESDFSDCENKAIQFYTVGIDGFECYYPEMPTEMTKYLVNFCNNRGLMVTAGSDDHGGFIGAPEDLYFIGAVKAKLGVEKLALGRVI